MGASTFHKIWIIFSDPEEGKKFAEELPETIMDLNAFDQRRYIHKVLSGGHVVHLDSEGYCFMDYSELSYPESVQALIEHVDDNRPKCNYVDATEGQTLRDGTFVEYFLDDEEGCGPDLHKYVKKEMDEQSDVTCEEDIDKWTEEYYTRLNRMVREDVATKISEYAPEHTFVIDEILRTLD